VRVSLGLALALALGLAHAAVPSTVVLSPHRFRRWAPFEILKILADE